MTPGELRATSTYLAYVSGLMHETHSALKDMLSGEGEAWGNDKIGNRFADGAQGYRSQSDWVDGSIDAKTELLDYYAEGLRVVADALEQQDSTWT
ncbi:hypothetical protein [Mycobacterium deserti]|uniref:Uncharacterized protein n=1 Tax=Mycobacterium deserti TaxID=2978347 RepID=A0ABT2MBQ3_9MYCO|nr:hypothetical protein [Mycobacterium deserti]MCT7659699.1 hypothetical protein [Mycobacterium deserti]